MRKEKEMLVKRTVEVSEYYDDVKLKSDVESFDTIATNICDIMGWDKDKTFMKYRRNDVVFRRGIIDLIATCNGCTLMECAKATERDHTTVINSLHSIENRLDTDMYTRKVLRELMISLREIGGT